MSKKKHFQLHINRERIILIETIVTSIAMESNGKSSSYKVEISIPFPTKRHAEIAYDVLRIDAEPKRSAVTKQLELKESTLNVSFTAEQSKHIRVGVNSFFDALILCTETMQQFGPPADQYNYA